jgi:predicted ArsR family transcriptional regulator
MKTRALRKGVWYRALTRVERACIDLVIKVVEKIRSFLLKKMVSSILKKLEQAMESQIRRLMREIGQDLVLKLSQIAKKWGNRSASRWTEDAGFVQFLTITRINMPH